MSYKTKKILMYIAIVLVAVLVISLIVSLVSNMRNKKTNDDFTKVDADWEVGALVNGKFDESHDTVLTSTYIAIDEGIRFIMKDNKDFLYTLYIFDENKEYLGAYSECDEKDQNVTLSLSDIVVEFTDAYYFRVTVNGIDPEDNHFNWFEKLKYSDYLTIYTTDDEDAFSNE